MMTKMIALNNNEKSWEEEKGEKDDHKRVFVVNANLHNLQAVIPKKSTLISHINTLAHTLFAF